jgi:hypothetical protein
MHLPPGYSYEKVTRVVRHESHTMLTKSISLTSLKQILGRAEERVAKLVDSPDRPESEASYKLDEGGWADV